MAETDDEYNIVVVSQDCVIADDGITFVAKQELRLGGCDGCAFLYEPEYQYMCRLVSTNKVPPCSRFNRPRGGIVWVRDDWAGFILPEKGERHEV